MSGANLMSGNPELSNRANTPWFPFQNNIVGGHMVATGLVWGSSGLCFRPYMTALEIFGILRFYTEPVLTTY